MTAHDAFDGMLSDWLDDQAGRGAPDYVDEILVRTTRTRQRPAWSSLERWLPVQLAFTSRVAPFGRLAWTLLVIALITLAAVVLLLAGVGQHRLPHFGSAANGPIAFVDGGNLRLAAADGANPRTLVSLPDGAEQLTFSPDGTRMAYRTMGSVPTMIVANADGSGAVAVASSTALATREPFAWSPDSRRLAFTGLVDGRRTIVLVNADGSRLTSLGQAASLPLRERSNPAWSPDGQWISYFSPEANGYIGLHVVRPDGTDDQRLSTSPINPDILEMSWAPDPAQRRLTYVSGGFVKMFDLATTKEISVGTGFWATWSPDASRISWLSDGTQVASVDEILAGNARAVQPFAMWTSFCSDHPELAGKAICSPAQWSPDSVWLYGPDIAGKSIVLATADGSHRTRTIPLGHPIDIANDVPYAHGQLVGPGLQVAWQPIAP